MKTKFKIIILLSLVIVATGFLYSMKVNAKFSDFRLTKHKMKIDQVVHSPKTDWKITKVDKRKETEEDGEKTIAYTVHFTLLKNKDSRFYEYIWINTKYYGANQSMDIYDLNGNYIKKQKWHSGKPFSFAIKLSLTEEQDKQSKGSKSIDILLKKGRKYDKYYLPLEDGSR